MSDFNDYDSVNHMYQYHTNTWNIKDLCMMCSNYIRKDFNKCVTGSYLICERDDNNTVIQCPDYMEDMVKRLKYRRDTIL